MDVYIKSRGQFQLFSEDIYIIPDDKTDPFYKQMMADIDSGRACTATYDEIFKAYMGYRELAYGQLEQLDLIFRDIKNGTLTTEGEFYKHIQAVKDRYGKDL